MEERDKFPSKGKLQGTDIPGFLWVVQICGSVSFENAVTQLKKLALQIMQSLPFPIKKIMFPYKLILFHCTYLSCLSSMVSSIKCYRAKSKRKTGKSLIEE